MFSERHTVGDVATRYGDARNKRGMITFEVLTGISNAEVPLVFFGFTRMSRS
jgi:hypothetical protein